MTNVSTTDGRILRLIFCAFYVGCCEFGAVDCRERLHGLQHDPFMYRVRRGQTVTNSTRSTVIAAILLSMNGRAAAGQ